jgi:hypothetical protein
MFQSFKFKIGVFVEANRLNVVLIGGHRMDGLERENFSQCLLPAAAAAASFLRARAFVSFGTKPRGLNSRDQSRSIIIEMSRPIDIEIDSS